MSIEFTSNTSTTAVTVYWKPVGRARRFDRIARGLARRLRIPFVRKTLWEMEHRTPWNAATTYGPMWTSANALADYSFACICHKAPRYSRNGKRQWRQRGHPRREIV